MSFPLDIRTELLLSGIWSDISPDVYVREPKHITRGRRDQGTVTDPARLSLTLNNKSGKYSPRNAVSPLYGQIGRNTRIRVSVPAEDSYLQLEGDPAAIVSTPDTAALDITGDIDVRAELAPNWYGAESQVLIGKWNPVGNQRSWMLRLNSGVLAFSYSADGTVDNAWFHGQRLPVMPERAAVRVTLDVDNGAGGRTVRFYWAESLAGTWVEFADPVTLEGVESIFNSTAPLSIAPSDTVSNPDRFPFIGRGYRFEVRNGIAGTVVANPDFTAQTAGATSFADSAGRTWTLTGGAEIRDREDRFSGEVSSWPAKWTPDEADVFVPIEASGILRRLGQGQKALDSTLRRRIPAGNPVAYWPLEEAQNATRAYSPIPGVQPAALSGVEWGSFTDLVSSGPLPRLGAVGTLSGPVPVASSGEWQVELFYNAEDDAPPSGGDYAELISFSSPDGTVRRWVVGMRAGSARIWGFDSGGNDVAFKSVAVGSDVFHGWTRLRFWARDNDDGTFDYRISWQDVGGTAGGLTFNMTGECGRLSYVTAKWGALTEGWGIGHLSVMPEADTTQYDGSDDAYTGETAWDRICRLGEEEGIPVHRIPGEITPERVGPQRPSQLVELLQDAADADGGLLLESPRRVALVYRDRSSLYTQEPALTLSYNAPGLAADLEPIDDDSAVRNDVTVTRDGGSSARAFLAEGPLSVEVPPNGIGVYDEGVTLTLSNDTQPEPIAHWRLHLGTFDGARYPAVTVMLHKPGAETLIPSALALREGDVIRLTDLPAWLSAEPVDLIVEGWSETLDVYRWEITFNCSPGGSWNLAQASHAVYGKADTDGSELDASVTSSATSLSVAGPLWTTSGAEMPIAIWVGGEEMSVTAISGATSPQSFTVTRSVNGVIKAHSAGSPVSLAHPAIASL
ncbi:hypothetical protein [Streptomyces sp. SP17KL33]|uniref:hypothetical protein n=1 Tax=Streptomyces sp. SP17KL33 TaxID=3002534 RepID=UPI002E784BF1|nr:hypothetical protein [Streptomyces sp. SP17KL33]MEE1835764.1 hypothetical protein [Streptomyces sp. SP17KL33]